jgi:acetylornithine deacetylase/succinyl-diaminopimelate desuccinylase-like protein
MNSRTANQVDARAAKAFAADMFDRSIVPALVEYIKIPNKSPAFDPDWEKNGHMRRAMDLLVAWCREHLLPGARVEAVQLPGRTPVLCLEVPGEIDDTILLYGHMDKQPEFTGWHDGLGPWKPVMDGDRLYGRGGADDGYSTFASLAALHLLASQHLAHARCVILIEGCEESGSHDLPYYVDHLRERIGTPSLVVCLDSGAGNYDQLWCTTSLRGLIAGDLHVETIREGVHSGDASGIVPSSFRVARMLLSRLERESDGVILPEWLHTQIPRERVEQAKRVVGVLGDRVWDHFPWHTGVRPVVADPVEMTLNRTWRPALEIIGARGLPDLGNAGNTLRPITSLRLSLRLPPGVNAEAAQRQATELLTSDVPYGARARFEVDKASEGWSTPPPAPWLDAAVMESSRTYFGKPAVYFGEGGTIPFMTMLGEKFPAAQFLITGLLGPESNAHGPNEFLHIPTAQKLTCCVADTIRRHALRPEKP